MVVLYTPITIAMNFFFFEEYLKSPLVRKCTPQWILIEVIKWSVDTGLAQVMLTIRADVISLWCTVIVTRQ